MFLKNLFYPQITNSTLSTTASRERLRALYFKELAQNNTFQNRTKNSVLDNVLSVTCPGKCNKRGTCRNGENLLCRLRIICFEAALQLGLKR